MQIGVSCLILPADWSLADICRETKAAGYEALELVLRDEGEISLQTPEAELKKLADYARDEGMYLASVCPQLGSQRPNLTHPDSAERARSVDTFRRAIDAVAAMGINNLLVVPGAVTSEVAYDEAYYRALQGMQALAPHAEAAGVNLAIEYVWNKFLLSPMEFARFCDEVGSERVGFFFDTGNMVIFGFPEQWARICGRHLMKVHFKDFKRQGYQWTPLLEGDVDFPAVMAELRRINYDDAVISEVSINTASLEDTAQAIRKILEM
ncbi:MAG: sugar phosphate isomerase/epimerase [Armatimonadetes bacterium]|nr:sugar phosphate isomerase/epimerase [Armatimonadota bacterium]